MKKPVCERRTFNSPYDAPRGWPPEDALSFIVWFQERLNEIPIEYRGNAKIEISKDWDGDITIEISYNRMETDEEEAARENAASSQEEFEEAMERQTLARLLAKYGNPQS